MNIGQESTIGAKLKGASSADLHSEGMAAESSRQGSKVTEKGLLISASDRIPIGEITKELQNIPNSNLEEK